MLVKPKDILNAQSDYYKDLYDSKVDSSVSANNMFLHVNSIPVLGEDDSAKCDGKLSLVKRTNVLKKIP